MSNEQAPKPEGLFPVLVSVNLALMQMGLENDLRCFIVPADAWNGGEPGEWRAYIVMGYLPGYDREELISETALDPDSACYQCFRRLVEAMAPLMPDDSAIKLRVLQMRMRREHFGA